MLRWSRRFGCAGMRFVLFGFLLVSVLATLQTEGNCQAVAAGAPIRDEPFFPAKWRANNQSTKMVPWEGERVVLLTLDDQLEPQTMAVFLRRLDGSTDFDRTYQEYSDGFGSATSDYWLGKSILSCDVNHKSSRNTHLRNTLYCRLNLVISLLFTLLV